VTPRAAAWDGFGRRPAPERLGEDGADHQGGSERHGGRPLLLAGLDVEWRVCGMGQRVGRPVGHGDHEGPVRGGERFHQRHELGASSRLADEDEGGPGSERLAPEVEKLGGVDKGCRDPPLREHRDRGVAGGEGGAHPGEHDVRATGANGREGGDPLESDQLLSHPAGCAADRIGLAGDLGEEWVRKLP
jgi:hypothetical protein